MWLLYALGSAFFAGITAVLAKIGIRDTDSSVATAIRTIVILLFSWLMVWIVGSAGTLDQVSPRSFLYLALSGLATGGSWLCYFKALQLGDVNRVTPIDKSSTILTMLLAFLLLGEPLSPLKLAGMALIGVGTLLMITRKHCAPAAAPGRGWAFFAVLSALFASLTAILGKVGIEGVESNLGTALRTVVVLVMAWLVVFMSRKQGEVKRIDRKSRLFICLSGITTGLSWLCYYKALQDGPASVVVPIDKLSIVVTVGLSYFLLREKICAKALGGLLLIVAGTLTLVF